MEDPAPGFVKLRDATDVGHCQRLGAFGPVDSSDATVDSVAEDDVVPMTAEAMASARALTKLTPAQITFAHDVLTYTRIDPATQKGAFKRFRLMVKRRLNTAHKEDLAAMAEKSERQGFLSARFEEYEERIKPHAVAVRQRTGS